MVRIVTAFPTQELLDSMGGMLQKSGIPVRYHCRTGAEVIRAVHKMGGGVVVCGNKLPDMTAERLSEELGDEAMLLMIAKPQQLELCEAESVFKLAAPIRASELAGSVNMLIQFDQKKSRVQVPMRSQSEQALILSAKALLMDRNGLTEEQAHRLLQRRSMETSSPMAETARLILNAAE